MRDQNPAESAATIDGSPSPAPVDPATIPGPLAANLGDERPKRITWTDGRFTGEEGRAGGLNLFSVHWGTRRQEAMWSLSTTLPIASGLLGQHYDSAEDAKTAGERLLDTFIKRISATTDGGGDV